MRNGSPRKKVGASTGWSCGPAMKTSLITKRGLALVEQSRVGSVGSSQALLPHVLPIPGFSSYRCRSRASNRSRKSSGRNVLPILKDRRQTRDECHQLLHLAMGTSRVTNRARRTPVPAPSYSPAAASSSRIRRPGSLGYWLPRLLRITMPSFRVGIIPI
jgi:hypothetical protein